MDCGRSQHGGGFDLGRCRCDLAVRTASLGKQLSWSGGMLGLAFAFGLPGWAVVRWAFNLFDKRRKADLLEVMTELREGAIGGKTE